MHDAVDSREHSILNQARRKRKRLGWRKCIYQTGAYRPVDVTMIARPQADRINIPDCDHIVLKSRPFLCNSELCPLLGLLEICLKFFLCLLDFPRLFSKMSSTETPSLGSLESSGHKEPVSGLSDLVARCFDASSSAPQMLYNFTIVATG